jgi:hypothetical protein
MEENKVCAAWSEYHMKLWIIIGGGTSIIRAQEAVLWSRPLPNHREGNVSALVRGTMSSVSQFSRNSIWGVGKMNYSERLSYSFPH